MGATAHENPGGAGLQAGASESKQLARREGPEVANRAALALKARGRVAERANLSDEEAMELGAAEQHAMRAERTAAQARSA